MKVNTQQEQTRPQVAFIRRPPVPGQKKVIPMVNGEFHEITPSTNASQILSQFTSPKDPVYSDATKLSPTTIITTDATTKINTTPSTISEVSHKSDFNNVIETKKSSGRFKQWYNGLTPKKKMLLRVGIIGGILLVCATIAILLVVFLVILRPSSTTTTTTAASIVTTAAWTFDQTAMDTYGVYNGTLNNGANYSAAATNQPYIGNGRALTLVASNNQSFMILAPFLNLSFTSFTIEAWIYPTNITGDRGIFSQCACPTCSNQCLYFIIRAGHLYVDFTFNSLSGSTTIAVSTWYHVAFVYNYAMKQQILYVNGVQDTIASNAQPYQGTNGSIQIGAATVSSTTCYFNGYIDNVKLTTQAQSSTQILFDASVTAYYSFDSSSLNNDNGPNGLNGASFSTTLVNGRVNQAIHFSGSSSYFQAYGFYQLIYSMSNQPFSVSLWVNPTSLVTSNIIQITQSQLSGGGCFNFLDIISPAVGGVTSQLVLQGYTSPITYPTIYGPFLTTNTWTHVSITYSAATGMTLYVNGVLFGSTGALVFNSSIAITWLQIGYNFASTTGTLANGGYQGSIDEVYVHSRALTQADITGLANP